MPEAKEELNGIFEDDTLKESNVPIAIIANKIDKMELAVSESHLIYYLDLFYRRSGKGEDMDKSKRPIELFMCSLFRQQGIKDAFTWIGAQM